MSQTITLKVTLEKTGFQKITSKSGKVFMAAPIELFYQGQSGTYMDLVGFINNDRDQFDNDGSIALPKKKGEDTPTVYCGSIKTWNKAPTMKAVDASKSLETEEFDEDPF